MKRFLFHINEDLITSEEEIGEIPSDFISMHHDLGNKMIYYKIEDGEITKVIAEGRSESGAKRRAESFISYLVAHIY